MSIGRTVDPPLGSWGAPHEEARLATDNAVDQQLVRATREEIQRIAHEIAQLAKGDLPPGQFFEAFLHRVVAALASTAGLVWRLDEDGTCHLAAETYAQGPRLGDVLGAETHQALLCGAASDGNPLAVPPHATSTDHVGSNPTEHLLLVVPIAVHGRVAALVEIFQRPDRGPATERGYLRFLVEMADLAAQYLLSHQLRELGQRQAFWQQLEGFLESIHTSLDVRQTSYAVVNESRRLLDCDRVSLALGRGRQCRVVAVSGLDSLDRRAQEIRLLGQLAGSVVRMGEPTWLAGPTDDLSPQLETRWNRYVDASHARACGVLPLYRSAVADEDSSPAEPFGALIVEQLKDGSPGPPYEKRAETLARHSAAALSKAVEHESLFLLPLWKMLGKAFAVLGGNHYPKVLVAVTLLTLAAVGLTCSSSEFALAAKGKLQPLVRRTIFAGESGVIVDVPVEHGQTVKPGQTLVHMRNTDLDVEITSLLGKRTTTHEQIVSVQRALLDNPRLDADLQNRLSGELLQLKEAAGNIDRQLALVRQKEQQLVVAPPIPGRSSPGRCARA